MNVVVSSSGQIRLRNDLLCVEWDVKMVSASQLLGAVENLKLMSPWLVIVEFEAA